LDIKNRLEEGISTTFNAEVCFGLTKDARKLVKNL
jgi:hypothetical protein